MQKSILIICYDFIPYYHSPGGVLRVLTLAEYLQRCNVSVNILCAKGYNFGYFGYEENVKSLNVHYVNSKYRYMSQKKIAEATLKKSNNISPVKKKPRWKIYRSKLKNWIENAIPPDTGLFDVFNFIIATKKIIKNNSIMNVFVSSPPHSMQIVGYALKKGFKNNINVICDYRDSWNGTHIFQKNNKFSNIINRFFEKKVIKSCDHFTYISGPMITKIEKLYSLSLKYKSSLIMNGYTVSIDVPNKGNPSKNCINIGYFGSISDDPTSFRNVSNLFTVLKNNEDFFTNLNFYFYGTFNLKNHDISSIPNITFKGPVNHNMALEEMSKMDYLLILHSEKNGGDEVLTGKLFDYISVKKPIICIGPEIMEAKNIICRYNLGITINNDDLKEMKNKLMSLKEKNTKYYQDVDVSIFHRDNQYKKLLPLLK